jgi:hypothetical protein
MKKLPDLRLCLSAALLAWAAPAAFGATELQLGMERFQWTESAPGGAQLLEESGPRLVLSSLWEQDKIAGVLFGLRGRAFVGNVDYDGQTWGGTSASTDVGYIGADFQARAAWRMAAGGYRTDLFGALGYGLWTRDIESTQTAQGYLEFWRMAYAGVGLSLSQASGRGLYGEALVGKPFSVRNKAFLADAGFDGDVTLKPEGKRLVSLEAGYRWEAWSVAAYYRQVSFDASGAQPAFLGGTPIPVFQPESEEKTLGLKLGYRF